jgi:hypothetical protein
MPSDSQSQSSVPLPLARRTKGVMNANEKELHRKIGLYEIAAKASVALVVIGLLIEVAMAADEALYNLLLSRWDTVAADALVALGVFFELLFSAMASRCQSELQRRANLEIARLRDATAWRSLEEKQHKGLALALRENGTGASVRLCVLLGDQESYNLANRISIPFAAAGWKVGYRFETYLHGIFTGICLPEPAENWLDEMKEINRRVREAFIAAEIPFINGWPVYRQSYTDDNAPLSAPIAWVYVGPRPMPPI